MARFFVGQRVKKVRGKSNIGATGRVVSLYCYAPGELIHDPWVLFPYTLKFPIDFQVQMDNDWVNTQGVPQPKARIGYAYSDDWEPIVPDGEKKIEWEESLFIPDGKGGLVYNRELIEEPAYAEVSNRSTGVSRGQCLRALRQVARPYLQGTGVSPPRLR